MLQAKKRVIIYLALSKIRQTPAFARNDGGYLEKGGQHGDCHVGSREERNLGHALRIGTEGTTGKPRESPCKQCCYKDWEPAQTR